MSGRDNDWSKLLGTTYDVSDPEYIGAMPVRQDLPYQSEEELQRKRQQAIEDWKTIPFFPVRAGDGSGMECKHPNNIRKGSGIMFRPGSGGWYMVDVKKKLPGGLYVDVQVLDEKHTTRLPVKYDAVNGWTVRNVWKETT